MFRSVKMRVENHIHIRHIMLYHFEKGHSAAEAFRDLNELFGEGIIGESGVRKWFIRFKSGDTSLEDKEGRGRKSDFDDQALLDAVEEDENDVEHRWPIPDKDGKRSTRSTATFIWLNSTASMQPSKPRDRARRTTSSFIMTTPSHMSKVE